jgi:hypothetical protein
LFTLPFAASLSASHFASAFRDGLTGYKRTNQPTAGKGVRVTNMAGIEKGIKKATKGSSGKKGKKSGGSKKSSGGVEKAAKKLLK